MKWRPIIIGAVIGGLVGLYMGKSGKAKGANNPASSGYVTGKFARPFQWGTDKGA